MRTAEHKQVRSVYKAFWQHDLVTYREVLAFSRGEQVERDTLEGRRKREMNP